MIAFTSHAQTVRIDSLKKALPALAGPGKIACLNAIAREYNYILFVLIQG